jgi:uncharacterized protein YqfA (UPF0365 family)
MDYMNLRNIDADTQMRSSFGKIGQPDKDDKGTV